MKVCIMVLVLAMAIAGSASANLLLNGDFNTWSGIAVADNWKLWSATTGVGGQLGTSFAGLVRLPEVLPDGNSCTWNGTGYTVPAGEMFQRIKLRDSTNGGPNRGGLYQQVTVVPGKTYVVSAWILTRLTSTSAAEAKLGVDNGAFTTPSPDIEWSDTVSGNSDWVKQTIYTIPSSTTISVFLQGFHPTTDKVQCDVFFDDASVTELPEPSGIVAMLSGMAGLVGYGIRRRK